MPPDRPLLVRKMKFIAEDLQALRSFAKMSLKQYLGRVEHEVLVERYLERIIGRMIDVNYHLIVESHRLPPRDYYESFIELGKMKVLPHPLAKTLAQAAGLQNRLAHEYDAVDPGKVHEAVKTAVKEVPLYLASIQRLLKRLL